MRLQHGLDCEACYQRDCDCDCRTCADARALRAFVDDARRIGLPEITIGATVYASSYFRNAPRICVKR